MRQKRGAEQYTDTELEQITKHWLEIRAQIEADPAYSYPIDRDRELQRHVNNKVLQALFKHAAYLFRKIQVNEDLYLYPREKEKIIEVYRSIEKNGYYSRSKEEERRARKWLANIVSRQYYRQFGKR